MKREEARQGLPATTDNTAAIVANADDGNGSGSRDAGWEAVLFTVSGLAGIERVASIFAGAPQVVVRAIRSGLAFRSFREEISADRLRLAAERLREIADALEGGSS